MTAVLDEAAVREVLAVYVECVQEVRAELFRIAVLAKKAPTKGEVERLAWRLTHAEAVWFEHTGLPLSGLQKLQT